MPSTPKITVLIIPSRIFPGIKSQTFLYIYLISKKLKKKKYLPASFLYLCYPNVTQGNSVCLIISATCSLSLLGLWYCTLLGCNTVFCHGFISSRPASLPSIFPILSNQKSHFLDRKKNAGQTKAQQLGFSHIPLFGLTVPNILLKPFLLPLAFFTILCSLYPLCLLQPRVTSDTVPECMT